MEQISLTSEYLILSRNSEDTKGKTINVTLIGMLEHIRLNKLHLFTLSEEDGTGSSHIVKILHGFLAERKTSGTLQSTLYM